MLYFVALNVKNINFVDESYLHFHNLSNHPGLVLLLFVAKCFCSIMCSSICCLHIQWCGTSAFGNDLYAGQRLCKGLSWLFHAVEPIVWCYSAMLQLPTVWFYSVILQCSYRHPIAHQRGLHVVCSCMFRIYFILYLCLCNTVFKIILMA